MSGPPELKQSEASGSGALGSPTRAGAPVALGDMGYSLLTCQHSRCRSVLGRVPGSWKVSKELHGTDRTEHGFLLCPNRQCRSKWEILPMGLLPASTDRSAA